LAYSFFVTCSKGIIVNLYEVKEISKSTLKMSDGTEIPLSRRRQKDVEAGFSRLALDKMRNELKV
ncbi:MAG: LytTR family DNA-binding domain-containing protein, partial [Ruminiclostridium sp.]